MAVESAACASSRPDSSSDSSGAASTVRKTAAMGPLASAELPLEGPSALLEEALRPAGGVFLEPRRDVAAGVESQHHRAVAEHLLNDLGMGALRKQQACRRVPQVVDAYSRQAADESNDHPINVQTPKDFGCVSSGEVHRHPQSTYWNATKGEYFVESLIDNVAYQSSEGYGWSPITDWTSASDGGYSAQFAGEVTSEKAAWVTYRRVEFEAAYHAKSEAGAVA